ncbi:hypothetical protein H5410_023516 [Solanum commersonii]|uniref:Uncharacterized protein n=1 Tax=Solanum commersonii TaxID=4109 RepID=A0A9J5ZH35_SOLCO|nr:hypothetical protein H5410_023516 [Solanum commersonii]
MAEIDTLRRVMRDTHLFDKLLDELPSFDLCITQQEVKISGFTAAMENERRTKKNLLFMKIILLLYFSFHGEIAYLLALSVTSTAGAIFFSRRVDERPPGGSMRWSVGDTRSSVEPLGYRC